MRILNNEERRDIIFLEQLEEMRKVIPNFGYTGRVGWVDNDNAINWCEDG